VDAVSGNYILGSPLFEHAIVDLGNGHTLEINVQRASPRDQYIHSFALNGKLQQRMWFQHAEIAKGGTLTLTMKATPNLVLGTAPASLPPSLTL
jgi:putative alpha-1,2-mannosidase